MAYDYNIDTPNLFGNFVRGQEITEQRKQRALENQQIEQDRAQKEQDRTQQTVANFSRQWASAAPQAKPLLARVARQAISQNPALAEALGGQVPETDDPAEWDNFMGGGALLGQPEGFSNAGSGFLLGNQGTIREIPGFPKGGKAQIVKIGDGQGGYQQMVFEGGQLRPLTMAEQQEAQGAPQQPQMQQVNAPGMDDKVLAQANLMVQQGVPDAQIEAWMQEQLGGVLAPSGGPQEPAQPQAIPAPAPQPVARRSYADTPLDQVGGGTPAPPRFGYTPPKAAKAPTTRPPAGYRWTGDGRTLEPIPGGPKDTGAGKTGASNAPSAKAEAPLRKEYQDLVKDPLVVVNAFKKVKAAADNPSAAGDLSMIFAYMKMLDPNSVVRETEFANAQNAAGVPDQIRNQFNRVKNGERLNPNQRADFINQASQVASQSQATIDEYRQRYGALATEYGFAPERIVFDPNLNGRKSSGGPAASASVPTSSDASVPLPRMDGGNNGWSIRVKK